MLWTDCVTGCWLISGFMFISWVSECVCNVRRAHHSSSWHVWEGSSHVLRPSAPLSILVGALACGGSTHVTGKQRGASCERACSGKKKIPPVCPLHNGQCSAYKTAILSTPSIQEPWSCCRRCSQWKCSPWHNSLCEQFHVHGWIIKGVTVSFSDDDCSDHIGTPQDWWVISNSTEVWLEMDLLKKSIAASDEDNFFCVCVITETNTKLAVHLQRMTSVPAGQWSTLHLQQSQRKVIYQHAQHWGESRPAVCCVCRGLWHAAYSSVHSSRASVWHSCLQFLSSLWRDSLEATTAQSMPSPGWWSDGF